MVDVSKTVTFISYQYVKVWKMVTSGKPVYRDSNPELDKYYLCQSLTAVKQSKNKKHSD